MDRKITQFPANATVLAADLIPIVSAGSNAAVTAGVFSLNLPNAGNRGLSKDLPVTVAPGVIALTSTVMKLNGVYTLATGTEGQYIELVALDASTVTVASSPISTVILSANQIVALRFITGIGWLIVSNTGASIT